MNVIKTLTTFLNKLDIDYTFNPSSQIINIPTQKTDYIDTRGYHISLDIVPHSHQENIYCYTVKVVNSVNVVEHTSEIQLVDNVTYLAYVIFILTQYVNNVPKSPLSEDFKFYTHQKLKERLTSTDNIADIIKNRSY